MNHIQEVPMNNPLGDNGDDFLLVSLLILHPQSRTATKPLGVKIRLRPRPRPVPFDLLIDQDGSKKRKVKSLSVDDEAALEMGTSFTTQQTNQQGPCPQTPVARRNLSSLVESKMTQVSPAPTRFTLSTPPRFSLKPKPRYQQDSSTT